MKLQEPLMLLGKDRFAGVDIRIRVRGGGHVAQIYAIRQALSKALVAYYQKYVDELYDSGDEAEKGAPAA